ncbi:putative siderophore transport system ATP-binding protein YusV [Corynebacterium diphtheriae]|nr:putative siderophore transport system ATP-binding protein YusV [Corynebacterium diphtheriae]
MFEDFPIYSNGTKPGALHQAELMGNGQVQRWMVLHSHTWMKEGEADLHAISAKDAAQQVALLPQHPVAPDELRVGKLVARGRHPYQGRMRGLSATDREIITQACGATEIVDFVDRDIASLSGGQR